MICWSCFFHHIYFVNYFTDYIFLMLFEQFIWKSAIRIINVEQLDTQTVLRVYMSASWWRLGQEPITVTYDADHEPPDTARTFTNWNSPPNSMSFQIWIRIYRVEPHVRVSRTCVHTISDVNKMFKTSSLTHWS